MFVSKMRHAVANIVALSAQIFGRLKPCHSRVESGQAFDLARIRNELGVPSFAHFA
jgi:hypothetical protein